MAQFTTTANATEPTTTGDATTEQSGADKVAQWLNLGPAFANTLQSIMSIFNQDQISDYEREIAVNAKMYDLQYQQQQQQQKTIIIAASVCLAAIIVTVMVTRK